MRNSLVRSPWSVVSSGIVLGAIVVIWLISIESSAAQQPPAPAQDKNADPASGQKTREVAKPVKAAEPSLEEMLKKALKDNPDIRVAEAKVREADAELNRTRLQVTQKVLAFHHSRESQKAIIKVAEDDLQRIQKLEASRAVSQEEVKQAQQRLSVAKAKLAEIEAEMPYLLGQQHKGGFVSSAFSPDGKVRWTMMSDGTVRSLDAGTGQVLTNSKDTSSGTFLMPDLIMSDIEFHSIEPFMIRGVTNSTPQEAKSLADKVRKALDTKVTVDYRQKPVSEILDDLKKKAPELSIHDLSGVSNRVIYDLQINGQVPLRTALELLADTCNVMFVQELAKDRLSFVLRDYGLLFAPSASLPPGAVHISNLGPAVPPSKAKEKPAEKTEEKGQPEKKH
jgi:hypothetical protein